MRAGHALWFAAMVGLAAAPLAAQFTVTPGSLDFGEVIAGESAERTFTARSDSFTPEVRATSSNPRFTVSPTTATLGSSPRTFTVRFMPTATGAVSGEISIRLTADNIEIGDVMVSGVGIEQPNDPPVAMDDAVETSEAG
jgi:hypothetical protein